MNPLENYPEIVYKYRNWREDNHKNILLQNQLFMASPKYFNDPFDCRIPTNYFLLDSFEKIQKYALSYITRNRDTLLKKNRDLENEFHTIVKRCTSNLEKVQEDYEKIFFGSQDKHYGVLSLSKRWDSLLMWSHYADNHTGYCVGFWESKLRESKSFGKGGPVNYDPENNYPIINPLIDENIMIRSFKETHNKAKEWGYEEEYRLVKLFYPEEPKKEDRTIKISDDFFAEINIGLMTPKDVADELIEIAKKKNIPVYQVKRIQFKFEVDRERII